MEVVIIRPTLLLWLHCNLKIKLTLIKLCVVFVGF